MEDKEKKRFTAGARRAQGLRREVEAILCDGSGGLSVFGRDIL